MLNFVSFSEDFEKVSERIGSCFEMGSIIIEKKVSKQETSSLFKLIVYTFHFQSLLIVTTVLIAVLSRRYCKKKPTKPPTDAQPEATNAEDTDVTATATSRPPIGPIVTGSTSSEITSGNVQDSTTPATTAPSGPAQANAAPNVPYPMPGIDPPLLAPLNDSTSAEPVHQAV